MDSFPTFQLFFLASLPDFLHFVLQLREQLHQTQSQVCPQLFSVTTVLCNEIPHEMVLFCEGLLRVTGRKGCKRFGSMACQSMLAVEFELEVHIRQMTVEAQRAISVG